MDLNGYLRSAVEMRRLSPNDYMFRLSPDLRSQRPPRPVHCDDIGARNLEIWRCASTKKRQPFPHQALAFGSHITRVQQVPDGCSCTCPNSRDTLASGSSPPNSHESGLRVKYSPLPIMTSISTFATNQLTLLQRELEAELQETHLLTSTHSPKTLQQAGLALLNLSITSQRTGLGGKTVLELGKDPAVSDGEGGLGEHGFRVGDIVGIAEQPKGAEKKKDREGMEKRGVEGVIVKVGKEMVSVALDKEDADVPSGGKLWLYVDQNVYPVGGAVHRLIFFVCNSQCQTRQRRHMETSQSDYDEVAEDARRGVQWSYSSVVWPIYAYPNIQ